VPSYWYSFTFAPNPDWSHRFSYGPEIQAYMERTARDFGVTDIVRFNTPVTELRYEAPVWRLKTGNGEEHVYDIVVSATGVLHHPAYPDIPGLDDFAGEKFHSARWDDSVDLAGKRVGVIGTGSTAAQIVGDITKRVGHMSVFQRTPQWMAPLFQKKYSEPWKRFLRLVPPVQKALYYFYYWFMATRIGGAVLGDEKAHAKLAESCMKNLEENISDPELREKLTPDYKAACKRIVICSDFYPAIRSDNAELVTDGIECIEPGGVRTKDGKLHELDVLVLATGFDPTRFILPTKVTGENGVDLEKRWDCAPRAHRAMSVPGFPNFWMIEGPTGPVGNLSLITISEYQIGYLIQCLDKMKREGLEAMAAREEAFEEYNAQIREGLQKTIWVTGGCNSWYLESSDRRGVARAGVARLMGLATRSRAAQEMKQREREAWRSGEGSKASWHSLRGVERAWVLRWHDAFTRRAPRSSSTISDSRLPRPWRRRLAVRPMPPTSRTLPRSRRCSIPLVAISAGSTFW
jgi:cation diffusion facilitator CzcD-associated flavoprotein CzcO